MGLAPQDHLPDPLVVHHPLEKFFQGRVAVPHVGKDLVAGGCRRQVLHDDGREGIDCVQEARRVGVPGVRGPPCPPVIVPQLFPADSSSGAKQEEE